MPTLNEIHGLPAYVKPELLIKDPSGRMYHWYYPITDETFRMHPDYPNDPIARPREDQLHAPTVNPVRTEYMVMGPGGETITVSDKESAKRIASLLHGKPVTDEDVTPREAAPSAEEIAAHAKKIAEQEKAEQAEVDAVTKTPEMAELAAKLEQAVKKVERK